MKDLTWEQVFAPFQPLLDLLKMDWTPEEELQKEIDDQERINALQDREDGHP